MVATTKNSRWKKFVEYLLYRILYTRDCEESC